MGACPLLSPAAEISQTPGLLAYYGDVRVGTISIRTGVPFDVDQWEWTCGFYPCEPGQHTNASAVDFEQARADFEEAWQRLLQPAPRPISRRGARRP
jgi:hypothetical protein